MAKYYIDAVNGLDTNTGTTPDDPWQTIDQFTNNAVAGDIGVLKWNTTWSHGTADINPLYDGSLTSPIILRAWDPDQDDDDAGGTWLTAYNTGTKPAIDFAGGDYQIRIGGDDFWILDNIDILNSIDAAGALYLNAVRPIARRIKISGSKYGMGVSGTAYSAILEDIELDGSAVAGTIGTWGLQLSGEMMIAKNITIEGYYKAIDLYGGEGYLYNVKIGQTTASGGYDIRSSSRGSKIRMKKVLCDETKIYIRTGYDEELFIEDLNTPGYHAYWGHTYKWSRDTVNYTGGATDSLKVEPLTDAYIDQLSRPVFEWKITDVTAAAHTLTIQVMGNGWDDVTPDFPTADELYIEVEYYDQATGITTTTAKSTDVLTANGVWTAFNVSFTPAQDGDIYVRGYLKKYYSGASVNFNGEVTIT